MSDEYDNSDGGDSDHRELTSSQRGNDNNDDSFIDNHVNDSTTRIVGPDPSSLSKRSSSSSSSSKRRQQRQKLNRRGCYQCGSESHRAKDCPNIEPCHCEKRTAAIAATAASRSRTNSINLGSFGVPQSPNNNNNNNTQRNTTFRYVELFAGIGGFRIALDKLGGQCVFACEIDRFAKQCYSNNFNGDIPAGDITTISTDSIPDHELLVGGFPCQSFSSSGQRKGFQDEHGRGLLFLEIVRILQSKQPNVVLLENVRGLTTHDNGKTLATVLSKLRDTGYQMYHQVLDAVDIVPQERKRIYIVGIRKDLIRKKQLDDLSGTSRNPGCQQQQQQEEEEYYKFPTLPKLNRGFQDIMERDLNDKDATAIAENNVNIDNCHRSRMDHRYALSDHQLDKVLSQPYTKKFPQARFLLDVKHPTKTLQSSYTKYMVGSQFVPTITSTTTKMTKETTVKKTQTLPIDMNDIPETVDNSKVEETNGGTMTGSGNQYGVDECSGDDDDNNREDRICSMIRQNQHQWRKLTPREAARLQGFPESFQLCTARPSAQLGNAVIPSMICFIMSSSALLSYVQHQLPSPTTTTSTTTTSTTTKESSQHRINELRTDDTISSALQPPTQSPNYDTVHHDAIDSQQQNDDEEIIHRRFCQRVGAEVLLEACPNDERRIKLQYLLKDLLG